jgi:hypothetical protein
MMHPQSMRMDNVRAPAQQLSKQSRRVTKGKWSDCGQGNWFSATPFLLAPAVVCKSEDTYIKALNVINRRRKGFNHGRYSSTAA